jgi:hypothetical protein
MLPPLVQAPVFIVLYHAFRSGTVDASKLFGVPLSPHLVAGGHLLVFAASLALVAALACGTARRAAYVMRAAPQAAPTGLMATVGKLAPYTLLVSAALLPLANVIYLVTSTAGTLAENTDRTRRSDDHSREPRKCSQRSAVPYAHGSHAIARLVPPGAIVTISFGDVPTIIVAKQHDLDTSRSWHEPRLLPQGYVVVPVDEEDQDAGSGHLALAFLRPWPDHQVAILWIGEDREVFLGKEQDSDRSDWPMNKALRELGVDATGHLDELDALGLDRLDWGR